MTSSGKAFEYKLNGMIITDPVHIALLERIEELERRVLILETNPLPIHDHDYDQEDY